VAVFTRSEMLIMWDQLDVTWSKIMNEMKLHGVRLNLKATIKLWICSY